MTLFSAILKLSGLSIREAADFLSVRPDTVKSWSSGKRTAPEGAYEQIHELLAKQEEAAGEAISLWKEKGEPEAIEMAVAGDNAEAQSIGWPSVGAQMATIVRVWEMSYGEFEIILVERKDSLAAMAHDEFWGMNKRPQ